MTRWEYCKVTVVTHRSAANEVSEQIEIRRYHDVDTLTLHGGNGLVDVLNELGAKGWNVFDFSGGVWLKRKVKVEAVGPLDPNATVRA
jgi:hypothetical protein